MSLAIILPLLSAFLSFFLGILVFKYGVEKNIKQAFSFFSLATTIWMFGTFMMFLNKDNTNLVIFWDKMVYVGVVFIPVTMFHFGLALTNFSIIKNKILLVIGYIVSFVFLILIPTNLFISDAFIYEWGAHSKAQFSHHIFLIYFSFYIFLWFWIVYKYYKKLKQSQEKEKIKYPLVAFIIFAILGPLGFLPAYGVSIYPFAYVSGVIFSIITAYAVITKRLMDIKLALRQSSVYVMALVVTLIPAVIFRFLVRLYIPEFAFSADFGILIISVSIFPFLRNFFYRFANKYFFTTLYDPKKLIGDLTNALSTTIDEKESYDILVDALKRAFHSRAVGIMGYDKDADVFIVKYNYGFKLQIGDSIKVDKKIFDDYIIKDNVVVVEELKSGDKNSFAQFLAVAVQQKIEILAPMTLENKVVGAIILSEKESRDIYNNEDIETIDIIDSQMAISLENALLYSQTKEFNEKLTSEVENATVELRQANAELKKLDRAKSEFISIASHQLRTPLTVIKGYASMMLDGSFGEMSKPIHDNMEKVFDSNERLIGLVEDLLNVSRIESGRLKFDYEKAQLNEIVASVVEELAPNVKAKELYIKYENPVDLPAMMLDKRKIRQVIINIIDNSVKYTKEGGINITLEKKDKLLRFCITDTGMGISASDLPNLFKKFSRGEDTSIVHTEGTGLGLYVGKQMVEAHGGKIWAESEGVGKGAKFCFELPIDFQPPKDEDVVAKPAYQAMKDVVVKTEIKSSGKKVKLAK